MALPPDSRIRAAEKWLLRSFAAAGRPLDGLFRRLVGEENAILRYSLWVVFPLLLLAVVWFAASTPWQKPTTEWKLLHL